MQQRPTWSGYTTASASIRRCLHLPSNSSQQRTPEYLQNTNNACCQSHTSTCNVTSLCKWDILGQTEAAESTVPTVSDDTNLPCTNFLFWVFWYVNISLLRSTTMSSFYPYNRHHLIRQNFDCYCCCLY